MCLPLNSNSSLPGLWLQSLRLHMLSVTYAATIARNWLVLLSGQPQKKRIRTPLLSLQVRSRRLTPQQPGTEPRRNIWLVK